jgi:flavin-dependent thymidylate synthase
MVIIRKPEVYLFSHTKDPKTSIALAVSAWTADDFPVDTKMGCDTDHEAEVLIDENYNKAVKAFHRTALEFTDMIFIIKNVSRAFQQQLTRTRQAGYAIQSLRVVTKGRFADEGRYTMPQGLTETQREQYHHNMLAIQKMYLDLLDNGVPVEDARGILPLNIHSDISMHINFSSLLHMSAQRLCVNTQWEYRQVVNGMKAGIEKKMGKDFSDQLEAPCVRINKCPMREEYCGVPFWKYNSSERADLYERFISFSKDNKKWNIKWLGDETPSYVEMKDDTE